ncbi:hypothetical protein [Myceligenerans crystallogenes]|uniref:Peptidase inhibitor family I36 n=1 Tax=Myceligenerans crystallogenes TaxID=316335 RepID=A0ABP4ZTS7_9MICO
MHSSTISRPRATAVGAVLAVLTLVAALFGNIAAADAVEPRDDREYSAGVELSDAARAELQSDIDSILRKHPGGQQISVNEVAWEDGDVVLTLPLPGQRTASALAAAGTRDCPYLHTCLYDDIDWGYPRLALYSCEYIEDLGDYGFDNITTSYHNNQSGNAATRVWDYDEGPGLWTSFAPSSSSYVGATKTDRASAVDPC